MSVYTTQLTINKINRGVKLTDSYNVKQKKMLLNLVRINRKWLRDLKKSIEKNHYDSNQLQHFLNRLESIEYELSVLEMK
jgi:hypothetical protein